MEPFQKKVKEALDYFKFYNFHPPDINISQIKSTHSFTMPKDADFIVANKIGEIGWIEVKNTNKDVFYLSSLNERWLARAKDLEKEFESFHFIVQFKGYSNRVVCFTLSTLLSYEIIRLSDSANLLVPLLTIRKEGYFGKRHVEEYLDLTSIPFFQKGYSA